MSNVSDMFIAFKRSPDVLGTYIGHLENDVSVHDLEEVGVDLSRVVINLPRDVFPWLQHHKHWRQRRLSVGPSNGRTYEGYALAPTKDPSVYCLMLSEVEPGMGSRTSIYFVRATQEWFEELEQEFILKKSSLFCEVPQGLANTTFESVCAGMKPYYT